MYESCEEFRPPSLLVWNPFEGPEGMLVCTECTEQYSWERISSGAISLEDKLSDYLDEKESLKI